MKNTVLSLCVFLVLSWTATNALAQGKGGGARRAEKPAKVERPSRTGGANEAKPMKTPETPAKAKAPAQERAARQVDAAQGKAAKDSAAVQKQAAEKGAQAKGKGKQQQLRALEAQQQRHQAKHMRRQARLARIRELAVRKGDTDVIARVDKLIAMQQQVHQRKLTQLQQQRRAMTGSELAPAPAPAPAGQGGVIDAEKAGPPPQETPPQG